MSSAAQLAIANLPPRQRSKLTNDGGAMLAGVDRRSASFRRFKDLVAAYAEVLGGEGGLSESDLALVKQAAALTLKNEEMQAALVRGEEVEEAALTRLANASSRTQEALRRRANAGAKTKPRLIDQHLARYREAQAT